MATMAVEITDADILAIVEFTGATRDQAASLLRSHNGSLESAVNAYYENPNALEVKSSWDDAGPAIPFDYPPQKVPTFQIDATDNETKPTTTTAPSRPNSRMSNWSNNNTIDLTAEHAAAGEITRKNPKRIKLNLPDKADQSKNMSAEQQHEHDMQMAINMSMSMAPDQENGTITSTGQTFGPASRPYYDATSWALTTQTNTASQEIILPPEPEDRKRREGEPAFLRPSDQSGYLSALLTILHAIPLAREAFLFRSQTADNYGSDVEWWNGTPISLTRIVSMEDGQWRHTENSGETDLQPNGIVDEELLQMLRELQRLMVFLDLTKRAYGSSDALATNERIRGMGDPNSMVAHFLDTWQDRNVSLDLQDMFATRATKKNAITGDLQDETCLLLDVDIEAEHGQTIYDVVDRVVWSDQPDQDLDEVWFETTAPIFTMRLRVGQSQKGVDVKIPAVWYPDRYSRENIEAAKTVRKGKLNVMKQLEKIDEMMERHLRYRCENGEVVGVRDLLESTTHAIEENFVDKPPIRGSHVDLLDEPRATNSEIKEAVKELKALSEGINRKLASLQRRREEAIKSLRNLTKSLTDPSSKSAIELKNKYTLRGVSTHPHITYVLRRVERSDADSADTVDNEWQWWRISFSKEDAQKPSQPATKPDVPQPADKAPTGWGAPVGPASEWQKAKMKERSHGGEHFGYTIQKVREIEVLKAAREESNTVLLVYASEKAMEMSEGPPELALKEFVATDNELFEAGLAENTEAGLDSPSPPERKLDSSDADRSHYTVDLASAWSADSESSHRGFDERVPLGAIMNTNFSDITNVDMADTPAAQEMQEKSGSGLLGNATGTQFGGTNNGSTPTEIGSATGDSDDVMEISHEEYVR